MQNNRPYILIRTNKTRNMITQAVLCLNNNQIAISPQKATKLLGAFPDYKYERTYSDTILKITDTRVINANLNTTINRTKSKKMQKILAATMGAIMIYAASKGIVNLISNTDASDTLRDSTRYEDVADIEDIKPVIEVIYAEDNANNNVVESKAAMEAKDELDFQNNPQLIEAITRDTNNNTSEKTFENSTPEAQPEQPVTNINSSIIINYIDIAEPAKKEYVENNYGYLFPTYGNRYGVDPQLLLSIVATENPYKEDKSYNRGIAAVENVWWYNPVTAYNFETKQYETIIVDPEQLNNDEYTVKISSMIFASYYEYLCQTCPEISDKDKLIASIIGYNKGIYGIVDIIKKYGSDFVNHFHEVSGGENRYVDIVLSYIHNGDSITLINPYGEVNTNVINVINQPSISR